MDEVSVRVNDSDREPVRAWPNLMVGTVYENPCPNPTLVETLIDDLLESWEHFRGQARRPDFVNRLKRAGAWIVGRQHRNPGSFPLVRHRLAGFLGLTPDEARRVIECLQKIGFLEGEAACRRGRFSPEERERRQIEKGNLSFYAAKQFRLTAHVMRSLGLADTDLESSIPETPMIPSNSITAQDVIKTVRTDYVVSSSVLGTCKGAYRAESPPKDGIGEHERVRRELQAKEEAKRRAEAKPAAPPDLNAFWANLGMVPPLAGELPESHKERCRNEQKDRAQAARAEAERVEAERRTRATQESAREAKLEARKASYRQTKLLKVPDKKWFARNLDQARDPDAWREQAMKPVERPRRLLPEDDGYNDGALRWGE